MVRNVTGLSLIHILVKVKFLGVFIFCTIILACGCSSNQLSADEIKYGETILSFYDTDIPDVFYSDQILIETYNEKINDIVIRNENVITYHNIRVGDSADKVRKIYKHETEVESSGQKDDTNERSMIFTAFENDKEVENNIEEDNEDRLYITYLVEDNVIVAIQIYSM